MIAIAIVAVVGITLYFAFGMPGMDHGASSPTEEHDASTSASAVSTTPRLVDPGAFEAAMQDGDSFVVNVHTPYDGEIAGTDAFITFDSIEQSSVELPGDLSTPMLVYCRSGNMSRAAAETLTEMGYIDVVELDGGVGATDCPRPVAPALSTSAPQCVNGQRGHAEQKRTDLRLVGLGLVVSPDGGILVCHAYAGIRPDRADIGPLGWA